MFKSISHLHPIVFLIIATIFEVSGDAIIRTGMYKHAGLIRFGLMLIGGVCLFVYGVALNLAPVEFGQVAGLYIATLFVVWQGINYLFFQTLPTLRLWLVAL